MPSDMQSPVTANVVHGANSTPCFAVRGDSASPPLVLLHELGGSAASWRWFEPFAASRFRLVLVDLPGAGQSPVRPGMGLDDYADAVLEVLDRLGMQRANVAGVAFGAIVTAYLAARHPQRVASVMMAAIGPAIAESTRVYVHERADLVEREGMEAVVEFSLTKSFPPGFAQRHPAMFEEYRSIFLANDPRHYAIASRAVADAGTTLTERLGSITCRAAVVGGEFDRAFTPEVLSQAARALPNPVNPVVLAGAGHFPHLQTPAELAQLMDRFFLEERALA